METGSEGLSATFMCRLAHSPTSLNRKWWVCPQDHVHSGTQADFHQPEWQICPQQQAQNVALSDFWQLTVSDLFARTACN